jgi:alkanesulfonate monooxygenase SsuD/methylene tetrahydromethanopterin reductase-like flavin-dependent oxidoreductase (luciferase family)
VDGRVLSAPDRGRKHGTSELPSSVTDVPLSVLDLSPVAAGTTADPAALSFLRLRAGMPQPLASPEEAAACPYSDRERKFASERFAGQAVGSPETVRARLTGLLERTGADELMLTTMVYDIEDRIRSFELIAGKVAPSLPRRSP